MISEDNEIDVHISIVTICKDSSNFMFPTKLHRSNVKKKTKLNVVMMMMLNILMRC